ncbi:MAG: hypothetical protein KatS3mg013_2181 [Actinomycetota bacterium]|jgi:quercetin dioxygenase-like cupin family protein|nr:MAG: hypothetical protein KatS3mg013_2181 [Actinomycetota bacterium]
MPVERAADHPTFDLAGNAVTSYAAPGRSGSEVALFRVELPAGSAVPRHHHDHTESFVVLAGSGTMHLGEEAVAVGEGDVVVVPVGTWHRLEAGAHGVTIVSAMPASTRFTREDGSTSVPPWVA